MAKKTLDPPDSFWQDFSDNIPPVSQQMLREYESLKQAFERAREEMDGVRREIEELLLLGAPIEMGYLTAALQPGGRVVLSTNSAEEAETGEALPF